jgi:hypothetical protein
LNDPDLDQLEALAVERGGHLAFREYSNGQVLQPVILSVELFAGDHSLCLRFGDEALFVKPAHLTDLLGSAKVHEADVVELDQRRRGPGHSSS